MFLGNFVKRLGQVMDVSAIKMKYYYYLPASKAAFLENCLAVSAWILNGSSIESQEEKQPFGLSGVRFGSQAIRISW